MTLSERYAVASAEIVSESFDGDFVVLDLSCGKYFSFSDSANVIWEAVSSGVSPAELLEGGANVSAVELQTFIGKLVGHGLIAPRQVSDPPGSASAYLDRLAAATERPDVSVFDDLADLFMADPIHDVEEAAGWPAVRQA